MLFLSSVDVISPGTIIDAMIPMTTTLMRTSTIVIPREWCFMGVRILFQSYLKNNGFDLFLDLSGRDVFHVEGKEKYNMGEHCQMKAGV
jgi:hypothetical protein